MQSKSKSESNTKDSTRNGSSSSTRITTTVLLLLLLLHATAIHLFCQGFLLSRITLSDHSQEEQNQLGIQPSHKKLILILIDALRYDFILPHSNNHTQLLDPFNHNQLTLPARLTTTHPHHSKLFHFQADPPTTTLQRLKALTTGTLPTFIDMGQNFADHNIRIHEDSWLHQLHLHAHQKIGLAGDDTWLKLFGNAHHHHHHHQTTPDGIFNPNITSAYESFNVEDLDTVDNGVRDHFYKMLNIQGTTPSPPWDILIGHFLGLDHAGHRFGASHPSVRSKLREYDDFLEKLVERIEDDTLLVVMGDHGMDAKGDHGGDSFWEVSTALWVYSKTRPLVSPHEPLPSWALDHHHHHHHHHHTSSSSSNSHVNLGPTLGTWRTVSQIDIVPTLSLLLGVPIPFSNLGMLIPELFFRPSHPLPTTPHDVTPAVNLSATDTLTRAMAANAAQLSRFVERYAGSPDSPGHDLAPHVPQLRELYTRAEALYREQQQRPEEAFRAHRAFATSLLATSRRIWAQFIPSLMVLGTALMALSLLVTCKLLNCIQWSADTRHAPIRTILPVALSRGASGLAIGALSFWGGTFREMSLVSSLLVGASLGICLGILGHRPFDEAAHLDVRLKVPSWGTLFKLIPVGLHALALGSNSYTVWEDRVVQYLVSFSVFLPILYKAVGAAQARQRNRLMLFGVLFAGCVRLMGLSTVCREEQQGACTVTFYAGATSSGSPSWAMSVLLPLALVLPIVPAWFLGTVDAYRGPASLFFGAVWRALLLCAAQYWITDYLIAHDSSLLTPALAGQAKLVKLWVARLGIGLSLFSGTLLWLILPPCIDVSPLDPDEKQGGGKPRLLVLGFANAYASTYLMFVAACFGALYLVAQPVGQVVLALGLVAALSLVLLNHSLTEAPPSPPPSSSTITHQTCSRTQGWLRSQRIHQSDLNMLVGLHFLGHMIFFGTGHQVTLATIQWKVGFVGLQQAHKLLSPILILLNTFAGFFLVALCVPLFALWNLSPSHAIHRLKISEESPRPTRRIRPEVLHAQLIFIAIQSAVTALNMLFICALKRHLMLFKIFFPKILANFFLVIGFDLVFLIVSVLVLPVLMVKIHHFFAV
ncbi:hypothetical protein PCANC_10369 [Puccinia coronata f. sp. avenae]|uniref:Uncharacterized protein n=1 Tax=Puccinia coronata f. sp. avenae TaxID=200324 RepID=A0A2N5SYA4_9BASI|nr:hypothetical protein PCANC_10369 [Puccinia coronata f. sp. avenae]PLW51619.1 hypothetical protein PCASD_00474 [Puccinia coronata f. sp. avenae]